MRYVYACLLVLCMLVFTKTSSRADTFMITHYCQCVKCCGKNDGITASGKKAKTGYIACNWLPFGTTVSIDNKIYTVEDRGAKSRFGSKNKHLKHIDVFCKTHKEAIMKGARYCDVKILKKGKVK